MTKLVSAAKPSTTVKQARLLTLGLCFCFTLSSSDCFILIVLSFELFAWCNAGADAFLGLFLRVLPFTSV